MDIRNKQGKANSIRKDLKDKCNTEVTKIYTRLFIHVFKIPYKPRSCVAEDGRGKNEREIGMKIKSGKGKMEERYC
jgi:hypothetical protein